MLIPVRCFTCGKVLADKWKYFKAEQDKYENENVDSSATSTQEDLAFHKNTSNEVLNKLGLTRLCCRRHMLGHVDLIDII
jgi:DNA-directed RNA polymerase subunit N (RpoN/RPB10)